MVIGAGETQEIEALCVEEGRWSGIQTHRHSGRRAPLNVQAALHAGVGAKGQASAASRERQTAVWQRVRGYEGVRTRSATASLLEHLDAPAPRPDLPNLIDGQRGVIVGFGGQVLTMELFDSHEMLGSHYGNIMESMLLDLQMFHHASTKPVTAQGTRDLVVAAGRAAMTLVSSDVRRSNNQDIRAERYAGRDARLLLNGVGVLDAELKSQLIHLSVWNPRHSMLSTV